MHMEWVERRNLRGGISDEVRVRHGTLFSEFAMAMFQHRQKED